MNNPFRCHFVKFFEGGTQKLLGFFGRTFAGNSFLNALNQRLHFRFVVLVVSIASLRLTNTLFSRFVLWH